MGICGIIDFSNQSIDKNILLRMSNLLNHKASGNKIIYQDNGLGIIQNTPIIFSKSKKLTTNNTGDIFVFLDGVLFNVNDSSIKNMKVDNDIILYLYEKYGSHLFEHIEGEYSLVILDSLKNKIIIARDLNNSKQIYYTLLGDKFVFSSEIKAFFVLPEFKSAIDIYSLGDILSYGHISYPNTLFEGVKRLQPCHFIIINKKTKNIKIEKYWDINLKKNNFVNNENKITKNLEKLFSNSIIKRLNLNKNFGLFLSGGLDSTMILYFLNKFSESEVDTYTVNLPGDKHYASIASEYFNTNHHELDIDLSDIINITPKALWYLETFPAGIDTFHYFLSKMSKKKTSVFLGQYSEKLFFCGKDFIFLKYLSKIKPLVLSINKLLHPEVKKLLFLGKSDLINLEDPFKQYVNIKNIFDTKFKAYSIERIKKSTNYKLSDNALKNYSYISILNGYLSDTYFSFNQMVLNPFFDKGILNFSFSIPQDLKLKNNNERYLLKKLLSNKIPKEILNRKKYYWSRDLNFIKGNIKILDYYIDKLRHRNMKLVSILDKSFFKNPVKILTLFNLEIFLEVFFDKNSTKEPKNLKI